MKLTGPMKFKDWRLTLEYILDSNAVTATDIEYKTGLSRGFISNYKRRKRTKITEEDFNLLAYALNMHPAQLRYGIKIRAGEKQPLINKSQMSRIYSAVLRAAKENNQTLTERQILMACVELYNEELLK